MIGLTRDELAGSQLEHLGIVHGGRVPAVHAPSCRRTFLAVARAIRSGAVRACHDVSDGGLLAALAEMAIAGRLGATIDLGKVPTLLGGDQGHHADLAIAFAETACRFIVEIDAAAAPLSGEALADVPWAWVGEVTTEPVIAITGTGERTERVAVADLDRAWRRRADQHR